MNWNTEYVFNERKTEREGNATQEYNESMSFSNILVQLSVSLKVLTGSLNLNLD